MQELAKLIKTAQELGSSAQYWGKPRDTTYDRKLSALLPSDQDWKDSASIIDAWYAAYDQAKSIAVVP
jgi:hypothetical protein